MRILLKAQIPNEAGNAAIKDGRLGKIIESILAEQKPEAVYFVTDGGKRTALVFVDIQDSSQLPSIAEPWFLGLNASVEVTLAFTPQDIPKVMADLEAAVKKYS